MSTRPGDDGNYKPGDKVRVSYYEPFTTRDLTTGGHDATVEYFVGYRLRSADGLVNYSATQLYYDENKTQPVLTLERGLSDEEKEAKRQNPTLLKLKQIVYTKDYSEPFSVYAKVYEIKFDDYQYILENELTSYAHCAHMYMRPQHRKGGKSRKRQNKKLKKHNKKRTQMKR